MLRIILLILRVAIGVVLGVLISMFAIKAMEWVGHQVFPVPGQIDVTDPQSVATYMDQIPLMSKIWVVLSWAVGAVLGGVVAGRISQMRWTSWIPGAFTLAGMVGIALMIPHPVWMLIAGALAIAVSTWLADRFGAPSAPAT